MVAMADEEPRYHAKDRAASPRSRPSGAETPPELSAALARSKKARAAYDALPPSHRKQWNLWVGEAKRAETRERRAAKAAEELGGGARQPSA